YSFDYLATYDGTRAHYLEPKNLLNSLNLIQAKLATATPELAASLADFTSQIYKTDYAQTRIWRPVVNGITKIADGQGIAKVPPECRSGQDVEVVQTVVRQPPWVSGLPPEKILYNYVPQITDALEAREPLQLSFLMVHEW